MTTAQKTKKARIEERLLKGGFNKKDASDMVEILFEYIERVYGETTISKKAEIISTLWSK